jgi:hypothetical protein
MIRRMTLFRRIVWVVAGVVGIAAAMFVGANAIDYYRFHSAIRRLENLSEDQFRSLGDAAARITEPSRTDQLKGFEILQPISAVLWPKSSDFLLYELRPTNPRYEEDKIYLYARISTSPHNQEIGYFTNSGGKQRTKTVWNRDPEFAKRHAPINRLVTIEQWDMRAGRAWIVLADRIVVIDQKSHVGSEPTIAGQIPLSAADLRRINDAVAKLPPSVLGKIFNADGVLDGTSLHVSFDPEGKQDDPSRITLSNTWVEDLRPLVSAVSELGPKDCPIHFIEEMTTPDHLRNYPTTTRTQVEWDNIATGKPNLPWWCVWREWFG